MVVWIVIEYEVFASGVLRMREWSGLMMSYVAKDVVCVMRVGAAVLRMLDGIPQARLSTGCNIACVQCRRLHDCLLMKSERAGCHGACDQLV